MANPLSRVPLRSLRAVEAVARLGSLRIAAEEMGVTPGAVSQQVIRAGQILGRPLLDRTPGGLVPIATSTEVLILLHRGFADLASAVARAAPVGEDALIVPVAPTLAARWLIWRLPTFRAAHPSVRVRIDADAALVEPSWGGVDLCIRVGRGSWPGVRAERLVPQVIVPVRAPDLATRINDQADLMALSIIRETRPGFDWDAWLGPEGRLDVVPGHAPVFSDAQPCLRRRHLGRGRLPRLRVHRRRSPGAGAFDRALPRPPPDGPRLSVRHPSRRGGPPSRARLHDLASVRVRRHELGPDAPAGVNLTGDRKRRRRVRTAPHKRVPGTWHSDGIAQSGGVLGPLPGLSNV